MRLFLAISIVLSLAGCLVEEKTPEASEVSAVNLGDDSTSYFHKCKEFLTELRTEIRSPARLPIMYSDSSFRYTQRTMIRPMMKLPCIVALRLGSTFVSDYKKNQMDLVC